MKKLPCIFFLLASAAIHSLSFGQSGPFQHLKRRPVKIINFEQGLLNNETSGVITDARGYTWISTRTGLQRYNGYNLDDINPIIGSDTITINSPVYLFGLRNGNIWIGYEKGILAYNPFANSFRKIITLPPGGNSFYPIIPLLQTREGIWCLQRERGIVIYSENKTQPEPGVGVDPRDLNSLISSDNLITNQSIATNSRYIFILLPDNRLLEIDTREHHFNFVSDVGGHIAGFGCSESRLFIATGRLITVREIDGQGVISSRPIKDFLNESLSINCIQPWGENRVLASFNGKLVELDSALGYLDEFSTLNEDPVVPSGSIHHIYVNRFRRIWLSTNNDIRVILDFHITFEHDVYKNEKGSFVRTFYYDQSSHQLLAGTIGLTGEISGGIQLYDSSGNPLWTKSLRTPQCKEIANILKLADGEYLVTTFDQGKWFILSLKTRRLEPCILQVGPKTRSELAQTVWPNNVQHIDDTTFFIATTTNVFRCTFHQLRLGPIQPIFPFNANPALVIECFIYTSDGTLWAGTNLGDIYLLRKNGQLKTISVPGKNIIRCFAEDSLLHVWVGTDRGLFVYNSSGTLIKALGNQSGLLNDYIYAILPVGKTSAVFASTKLGLSSISLEGAIKNYTKDLGLQENEFNTESALETSSGKFYFGGVNGITAFYPAALSEVRDTPVLDITRLIINDSLCNFSPGIWRNDSILLHYDQNHIQLDIGALGLLSTDEFEYRYRMRRFEEKWQITHVPTGIKYVLPPGRYLFEMECTPIFSSATIIRKSILLIITPPWWQTWWCRLLVLGAFVLVIAVIVRQYSKRQYQRKIRALQLQQEIQHERERISRDLHDNIGAQLSFISSNMDWIIDKNVDGTKEDDLIQMKAINATAKNVMTNLRETIWALHKEKITMQEFSDKLKAYIQNLLQHQMGMEFTSEEKIEKNFILTPTEMLNIFRICQECINNVIKHAEATRLKLIIQADDKSFHILMEDNGKGFDYKEDFDGHYGLKNMKHRAAELHATLDISSQKGKGTLVAIHR